MRDGKNNSSGGAVGISLGVGSEGGGLSIFANANKATGNEKGAGTTWTETRLDAGKQVSLISGRDTALKGAQVSADKITATVGRDLTLQSLQDTDNYKSKQMAACSPAASMPVKPAPHINSDKWDPIHTSLANFCPFPCTNLFGDLMAK
ncbi:hypothetical protein QF045_000746 [Pseudomonas sp. W4I3]|nr:hypothetical protein [Pseudomonas sp. W4I3]